MSAYLLDTHVVLWSVVEPSRISRLTRIRLANRTIWVSDVSAIEIAIKMNTNKLVLPKAFAEDFVGAFRYAIADLEAESAVLTLDDISRLRRLPLLHRDPFDRLIIAQAMARGLTVVTADETFGLYPGLDVLEI